jgi:hypothetical protein
MAREEQSGADLPRLAQDIETFVRDFEACTLPKPRWTHQAHLLVGLWYVSNYEPGEALRRVRKHIRAYNLSVGTANTTTGGYHETLTRLYLEGIAAHVVEHCTQTMPASLELLLNSPLGRSDWPLQFYSRERLFSTRARRQWVAPDRRPR